MQMHKHAFTIESIQHLPKCISSTIKYQMSESHWAPTQLQSCPIPSAG